MKTSGITERGKIKVRFFELEVEGGSEALQDSVRTLAAALQRPAVSVTPRMLAGNVSTPPIVEAEGQEAVDEQDLQLTQDESVARPTRQRAKRTPPTPQVLDDVGFEDGSPTWAAFANSKSPDSDVLRVATVAVWFKRSKKVDSIGIDHASLLSSLSIGKRLTI